MRFESVAIFRTVFRGIAAIAFIPYCALAQGVLGSNLILNGNAEAGSAGVSLTDVVTIPSWKTTGSLSVLPYNVKGNIQNSDPGPMDHGFQYFSNAKGVVSTISQDIDVSSAASAINAGTVKYTGTAFLGVTTLVGTEPGQMDLAFKNGKGQIISTTSVGPAGNTRVPGTAQQQVIGLVPSGTVLITVTLSMANIYGVADSLSLVLNPLGTNPAAIEGVNLIANSTAEFGPSSVSGTPTDYIPGWSSSLSASVCPYGGAGWISLTDPGPTDRGVNLFCGGVTGSTIYQNLDVSAAAAQIDAGQLNYQMSAWLGVSTPANSPTLTYIFYDWNGKQLAATAQLGNARVASAALVNVSHSDVLPAGTRLVAISVAFAGPYQVADDISFTIGALGAPVITPSGIVPVYSSSTTIEPGSWVSIFGSGLASAFAQWNGDFPTKLGGTTVTVNGKPAFLWYVSPTQINLQAPDDPSTGPVSVVVTTPAGSATSTVTLGKYAPSFSMFNGKYPAAIVLTPGAPGNSGGGYDYVGPGNSGLSFGSRPVKVGETVILFGVGFGPTITPVFAGAPFSGAAQSQLYPTVTIGGVQATVSFAGIVQAGLYQFNVVVPNVTNGDKALQAMVGGVPTPSNVVISVQ